MGRIKILRYTCKNLIGVGGRKMREGEGEKREGNSDPTILRKWREAERK